VLAGCTPVAGPVGSASESGAQATWRARNTMRVAPDPARPDTAAVISRAQAGPSDFWCAAGDYAVRRLGAAPTDRVYILRGEGPSPVSFGRSAVTFTTDPPPELADGPRPGPETGYALSLETPGFNLRAAHARGYCPDSLRKFGFGRRF
jgi:hypothetical protein